MTSKMGHKVKNVLKAIGVTLFATFVLCTFLMPFGYGLLSSLKTQTQIANVDAPFLPSSEQVYTLKQDVVYTDRNKEKTIKAGSELPLYHVPLESGETKIMALAVKKRKRSFYLDLQNPEAGIVEWQGYWGSLEPVWENDVQWMNYKKVLGLPGVPPGEDISRSFNFKKLLGNTTFYAIFSTIGAVASASFVAYGFARFKFPGSNVLFMVAVATIILPPAVTLIPRYVFFYKLGWVGTWLPIIVPAYFSNGWNVFLMRQFFMGIPREMEEAAKIDGAGPLRTFFFVILPQSVPALVAVTLFHFFFCWNDFFEPLVFLAGNSDKYPITIGLTQFNRTFTQQVELIQASAIVSLAIPLIIFFFAQRFFMQGVVVTGVDK